MNKIVASLILPTYNGSKFIEECLSSISRQTFKNYELIIIDDSSKDETRRILHRLKYRFIKNKKRLGCTKTINRGIKLSKGEFIFRLDQDMVYDKNYLNEMIFAAKSDKNIGIVSCKSYYYKQKNKIRAINLKTNLLTSKTKVVGRDEIDNGQFDNMKEIESMSGGNLLVKKEVFDKIGLFPEEYLLYGSDIDLCLNAKKAGYKIALSKAKVWHKKNETENLRDEQFDYFIRDKITFMKRNSKCYVLFLIIFFLIYAPLSIIKSPKRIKNFIKIRI